MAFVSMLSMSPVGLSFPAGLDGGHGHSVEVNVHTLSTELQKACVLLLGNGLVSHWAIIMIFENGEVFSVELLARDRQTGERWGTSNFQMRQLRFEEPCLSEASSRSEFQHEDRGVDIMDVGNRLDDHPRKSTCADNSGEKDVNKEMKNLDAETAEHLPSHGGPRAKSKPVDDKITAMCKDLRNTFRGYGFLGRRRKSRIALIEGYTRHFDYDMLCDMMWVQNLTSPTDLFRGAKAVPLNGSQYDLLFHNCQLWVVMLLHDYYRIELWKLPWTIGCLVAGPLLLVVELSFLGVYLALLHVLPAVAIAFGILWFCILVWFSLLYKHRTLQGAFPWEVLLGAGILLGVPILDTSASLAGGLPFITLVWDMVVVCQSMRHTKVFNSPLLIAWNCVTTLLALVLATAAQTHYGVHAAPAVVSNVLGPICQFVSMVLGSIGNFLLMVCISIGNFMTGFGAIGKFMLASATLWGLLVFCSAVYHLAIGIQDLCCGI